MSSICQWWLLALFCHLPSVTSRTTPALSRFWNGENGGCTNTNVNLHGWSRFLASMVLLCIRLTWEGTGEVPLRDPCNNTTHICFGEFIDCRSGYCKCTEGYAPRPDNRDLCGEKIFYNVEIPQTDPTMIGVVIGLCLMSVTLCVVLRLFAKARFRENRTIFNTPNPRLMNVSLMKGSKHLFRGSSGGNHAATSRSRRGSQTSLQSTTEQAEIQNRNSTPLSPHVENGSDKVTAGSSRAKPFRQASTDTTSGVETPTGSRNFPRNKYTRQDSTPCNSIV